MDWAEKMTELLTAAQMRAIEAAAIGAGAVTGLTLMERAGQGVVEAICAYWPEFQAAAGKAVVVVSSYLPELLGLCDTVGVMCRGELAAVRPRSEWNETEIMRVATGTA